MTDKAPVQNSVVTDKSQSRPDSQTTPVPSTPGTDHSINWSFFMNNVKYRRFYFSCKKLVIKQERLKKRIPFLQACLKYDIVPPSLKLSQEHNKGFSESAACKFKENLAAASLANLKIAIVEEQRLLASTASEVSRKLEQVEHEILDPDSCKLLREKVSELILAESEQSQSHFMKKLDFLLKKEGKNVSIGEKSGRPKNKKNRKFTKRSKFRRKMNALQKKKPPMLVTNYSNITITKPMEDLLGKGLNFAVVPKHVNTTGIVAGFARMERTMRWREFFFEDEDDEPKVDTFVKMPWHPVKTNLPSKPASSDLNTFIKGTLACVLGSNLNTCHRNLTKDEIGAMNSLIELQKKRVITLKPNDKMGGVSVMNTDDYIEEMLHMLNAVHTDKDGRNHPYFERLNQRQAVDLQQQHLQDLHDTVDRGVQNGWITGDIANWLVPDQPSPGRLYGLVKDHVDPVKWRKGSVLPPMRPVESASGTTFENASHFVDLHSNHLVKKLPSYWEDTPDMLRNFDEENKNGPQDPSSIPITLDVSSLYTNIPINQGIEIMRSFLDLRKEKEVPTDFLIELLTLVLHCNILVFDGTHYHQRIGTAMGTRVAPTFACLFMGAVETAMLAGWNGPQPKMWRRYIDDIFFLWPSDELSLKSFIDYLNSFHPFLKFKANYNFDTRSVNFLDTTITLNNSNFISTTLFTKPGKKCTYLLEQSCHPSHIHKNIPYSLALRLRRICSEEDDFQTQLSLLKHKLEERGFRPRTINDAFARVSTVERATALKKQPKKEIKRIVLPLPYDPRLPAVSSILYRFWKVMIQTPRLKKVFPDPPMVSWMRPKNLREFLIRAKLPPQENPRKSGREKLGFKHCGRTCTMCSHSPQFCTSFTSASTKEVFPIKSKMDCMTQNVIYLISCNKQDNSCSSGIQYVGETARRLCDRFQEHRGTITNPSQLGTTKPVGAHFQQPGHTVRDLKIIPIEKIRSLDPYVRKIRESYYIKKLDTFEPVGLNRKH